MGLARITGLPFHELPITGPVFPENPPKIPCETIDIKFVFKCLQCCCLLLLLQTGTPVLLTMQTYFANKGPKGGGGGATPFNELIKRSYMI